MASDLLREIRFEEARGKRVLVALSGGADSTALLMLMHGRQEQDGFRLSAAHLHHGIRGAEADADAAFCRSLCASLGIELIEGHADVPALAQAQGQGLETVAREARHAFLHSAKQQCCADLIALAHHLNDQAETVLMHMLRGAGPEGACGMDLLNGELYRPLLNISKNKLVQFLEESGISWREDASNRICDNPRNALRLNVLPEIEKSYPSAARAIARYARLARVESNYIARAAEAFLRERLERGAYGTRLLLDGHEEEAILRRALRSASGGGLSAEKTEELAHLARQRRGRLEISGILCAERTPSALYFLPKPSKKLPEILLQIPGNTEIDGLCRISAEAGTFAPVPGDPDTEIFDADMIEGAVVRTRRNGDRIRPLGSPGDRLLSDYLTDRKLDRPLRDYTPLVAKGERILWVCGIGMADDARIRHDTLRTVRLKIHPITDENNGGTI